MKGSKAAKAGEGLKAMEVIFCGNSLYLSSLASSLQKAKELRVRLLEQTLQEAGEELKMLNPDVLIFEAVESYALPDLFAADAAQTLLIAVRPQSDTLDVLCGERRFSTSVDELLAIIKSLL
ncbi:hypothetical protein [Azotosporobacter soli]|uniref:hypothetical protein n=1 Tax=Azotosporobacter soli TaxID=3055040 RepID=UPI0031FF4371